jgi:hypothetical protein
MRRIQLGTVNRSGRPVQLARPPDRRSKSLHAGVPRGGSGSNSSLPFPFPFALALLAFVPAAAALDVCCCGAKHEGSRGRPAILERPRRSSVSTMFAIPSVLAVSFTVLRMMWMGIVSLCW